MPQTIRMAAKLPASSDRLFDMYLDPAPHAAFYRGSRQHRFPRGCRVQRLQIKPFPVKSCSSRRDG